MRGSDRRPAAAHATMAARVILAAALLAAALPAASGDAWIDDFYMDEFTATVSLSRTQPKFVGKACMFVGVQSGSSSSTSYAPQQCRLFWTFLWDAAGGSAVQVAVYGAGGVQLAGAEPAPKAGAAPIDTWDTRWNRDWSLGGGAPADKTYTVPSDPAAFSTLDAPYYLFASLVSNADQPASVSLWFAAFVRYATTVTRTPGGILNGAIPGSNSDFAMRACNMDDPYTLAADGRVCSRIQGELRIDPQLQAIFPDVANATMRVRLFDVAQLQREGTSIPTIKGNATALAARSGLASRTAPFAFAFGQSLAGGPPADNSSVALLYRSDSPALFVDLDPAAHPAAAGLRFPYRLALSATCARPASQIYADRIAQYARRSDPMARFGGLGGAAGGGLAPWAVALIVVGVAVFLLAAVGAIVYCVRAAARRERFDEGALRGGGGGASYTA